MKKIIIALAFVAAMVSAQAASVDWKIKGAKADVGSTVYLLTSLADSYESADALAAAAVSTGTVIAQGRNSYNTGVVTSASDSITKESMKNAYLVLLSADGKSYTYITADLSAQTYDPNNQETAPSAPFGSTIAAISGGTTVEFGNVPEPTSAMLIALGVAALALRRKQK